MGDNQRSANFRYVYSNGNKIKLAPNELTIIFGVQENPTVADQLFEEVGVIMTYSEARLLAHSLHRLLEQSETETTMSVPIGVPKNAEIEDAIRLALGSR